jgi:hypothetical protein
MNINERRLRLQREPIIQRILTEIQNLTVYNRRTGQRYSINPQRTVELRTQLNILMHQRELEIYGNNIINYDIPINNINTTIQGIIDSVQEGILRGEQYLLTVGDTFYTLSNSTIERLQEYIETQMISQEDTYGSDEQLVQNIRLVNIFSIQRIDQEYRNRQLRLRIGQRIGGAFFNYIIKPEYKIDLKKYDIFNDINSENYTENCLVVALKNGGMCEKKLNILRFSIFHDIIPMFKLDEICNKIKIKINLY